MWVGEELTVMFAQCNCLWERRQPRCLRIDFEKFYYLESFSE